MRLLLEQIRILNWLMQFWEIIHYDLFVVLFFHSQEVVQLLVISGYLYGDTCYVNLLILVIFLLFILALKNVKVVEKINTTEARNSIDASSWDFYDWLAVIDVEIAD